MFARPSRDPQACLNRGPARPAFDYAPEASFIAGAGLRASPAFCDHPAECRRKDNRAILESFGSIEQDLRRPSTARRRCCRSFDVFWRRTTAKLVYTLEPWGKLRLA
jgi:hypothetical protein